MAKQLREHVFDWSHRHWSMRPLWLRRFRRRHRWLVRVLVGTPFILAVVLLLLTRSPLTRLLVTSRLGDVLNLEVDADSVYVQSNGRVIMDRARFRLPGIPGPAGQFLNVDRIEAEVDWWSTLTGSPHARRLRMDAPVLTISQSVEDGSLNIGNLSLPASSGKLALPRVQIVNAGVEIGEHEGGTYHMLRHILMNGRFGPSDLEGPGGYSFRLQEATTHARRPGETGEPGFIVTGALAEGRISVELGNFSLDDWPARSVPRPSRDRFADLNLRGEVPRARLVYTREEGVTAELSLDGVGMNLPLELTNYAAGVQNAQGPFPRFLRMREVAGRITFARDRFTATVKGLLEDLPYDVVIQYDGLDENAPFTCKFKSEGFRVERNPSLLPYAPDEVRRWLATFSGPTAVLNTDMTVFRGPPVEGRAGPIGVVGDVYVTEGAAAFDRFPYPFDHMAGHFRFTTDEIRIVEVTGRSPSGATLHAHGTIGPLDETSEVSIHVDVKGAPIDDAMEKAFGPQRSQVIRALFNRDKYNDLVAAGLIQSREDAMRVSQELEDLKRQAAEAPADEAAGLAPQLLELERQIQTPVFDFRGLADISVHIHAPRGKDQPYHNVIDVSLASAGLVPEKFPLPIRATGVRVHIDNEDGRVVAGEFRALGGGAATVNASFKIPTRDHPGVNPQIDITVSELPVSELLIHALPGRRDGEGAMVKRILRDLRISGAGAGTVRIAPRPGGGDDHIGFVADLKITGAAIEPRPRAAGPLRIGEVTGRLLASEESLELTMTGRAHAPGAPVPGEDYAAGPVTARVTAQFPPKGEARPAAYQAQVECPGLTLTAPVETLVAVFSPGGADQLERLRSRYAAEGRAGVTTSVVGGDRPRQVEVALTPAGDLSAAFMNDRVGLESGTGIAHITITDHVMLRCEALAGPATFAGRPAGHVSLDGLYLLRPGPTTVSPDPPLGLTWREGPFESPLVARIARRRFGDLTADQIEAAAPHGLFDADLILHAGDGPEGAASPQIRGTIRPRSVALTLAGTAIVLPTMSGVVEFEPGSGVARQLGAEAPSWSGVIDAAWESRSEAGFSARAQISAQGRRLSPDLRALLPEALRTVLDSLSFQIDGPFAMEDASLDLGRGPDPSKDWTRFDGGLAFSDASLRAGVDIKDLSGRFDGTYQRMPGGPPRFHLDVAADRFSAAGVSLGRSEAVVESGQTPGEVVIPLAAGECHGGRFSGRVSVGPPGAGPGRSFDAQVQVSGARFKPLLADLANELTQNEPDGRTEASAPDISRGQLDAEFSLHGVTNRPEARRGRGSFRISGGRVINVPFMIRLVEVSNFVMPGNAGLDYAAGSFYVDSGLITFDDLAVHSKSIAIEGYGTMTWPEKVLDLRFNSRSERPIPILSALLRNIRDELVTTTVRGKLGQQEVRLQQFPGTRRMLGRAVGSRESEQSRRLADIERRMGGRDQSIRPTPGGIRSVPPEPPATSSAEP